MQPGSIDPHFFYAACQEPRQLGSIQPVLRLNFVLCSQVSHLSGLTGLTLLSLAVRPEVLVLDEHISQLTSLTALEDMHLSVRTADADIDMDSDEATHAAVMSALPAFSESWRGLRSLSLPCGIAPADGIAALGQLSGLTSLELHRFEAQPAGRGVATTFPRLQTLDVSWVQVRDVQRPSYPCQIACRICSAGARVSPAG